MLRRAPTALTITPEDIAAFEAVHARQVAYRKYLKTGQDPGGWFTGGSAGSGPENASAAAGAPADGYDNSAETTVDPNDELKPLPGDKARIVRATTREERIMGVGSAGGAAGGGGGGGGARR